MSSADGTLTRTALVLFAADPEVAFTATKDFSRKTLTVQIHSPILRKHINHASNQSAGTEFSFNWNSFCHSTQSSKEL